MSLQIGPNTIVTANPVVPPTLQTRQFLGRFNACRVGLGGANAEDNFMLLKNPAASGRYVLVERISFGSAQDTINTSNFPHAQFQPISADSVGSVDVTALLAVAEDPVYPLTSAVATIRITGNNAGLFLSPISGIHSWLIDSINGAAPATAVSAPIWSERYLSLIMVAGTWWSFDVSTVAGSANWGLSAAVTWSEWA